jgi:hypothetical protein
MRPTMTANQMMAAIAFMGVLLSATAAGAQAPSGGDNPSGNLAKALESVARLVGKPLDEMLAILRASSDEVVSVSKGDAARHPRHNGDKPPSWVTMFKDLRPGPCKPLARLTPGSSWPARGEPAVAFCQ